MYDICVKSWRASQKSRVESAAHYIINMMLRLHKDIIILIMDWTSAQTPIHHRQHENVNVYGQSDLLKSTKSTKMFKLDNFLRRPLDSKKVRYLSIILELVPVTNIICNVL